MNNIPNTFYFSLSCLFWSKPETPYTPTDMSTFQILTVHVSISIHMHWNILYNTLLNSDRLIGCLWSRDIE
jgi:hypothetical protein